MKNLFAMALVCSVLLAGCAGKKAVDDDQAIKEVAPVVAEQEAPVKTDEVVATEIPPAPAVKRGADKIFFDFDSHLLTPAGKDALEDNALWLQAQPEVRIVIEGHADERGSDTYNLALGDKRSRTARDYLVNLGVDPDRIDVLSYGEEKAIKGAGSETAWSRDRRAELVKSN